MFDPRLPLLALVLPLAGAAVTLTPGGWPQWLATAAVWGLAWLTLWGMSRPASPPATTTAGPPRLDPLLNALQGQDRHLRDTLERVVGDSESAVGDIIGRLGRLDRSASELVDYLGKARDQSRDMQAEIEDNAQIIEEVGAYIDRLPTQIRDEHQRVRVLLDGVLGLAEKAKLIKEISADTNMLAINASIEAARAGQYGKGFAVVADEVRELSRTSLDATEAIERELNKLNEIIQAGFSDEFDTALRDNEQTAARMVEAIRQLDGNHADLKYFYKTLLKVVSEHNQSLAGEISDALGCVQFQDIVRQKIQRLDLLLARRLEHLQGLSVADAARLEQVAQGLVQELSDYQAEEHDHGNYDDGTGQGGHRIELF